VTPLLVRLDPLKIALALLILSRPFCAPAQEYSVGGQAAPSPQAPAAQKQAAPKQGDQQLGWGSNIQNARLGRAAELALKQGNRVQALEFARKASQAAPNDPQLWFLLGYAARLNGSLQESANAYGKGLKITPSSLEGQSGLAQTYAQQNRADEAQKLLHEIVEKDPRRRGDTLLLGELYMRAGDFNTAVDWLGKAERMGSEARSELLLAISYQRLNQMDQANHYLQLAEKHAPDNPEVRRSMAGYYRESGNYDQAIDALKSIRNPKPDVVAELAYTYQLAGKPSDSARLYTQAANALPKDITLQLSAAQAEVAIGAIDQANSFLDRAAKIDSNQYRLHAIRGEVARIQEHNEDAVKEYNIALANLPKEPTEGPLYGIQLHVNLMQAYKDLGDEASVERELKIAQSQIGAVDVQGSGRLGMLRLRALIKLSANDPDGALSDMKEALALNAHDRDSLQLDGDILMKLGRTENAITVYSEILKADPNNRGALTSLGYASRVVGRDKDAEKYFQKLAQVDPGYYVPYLALGDLYTSRKEFPQAQEQYSKAYALAPKRSPILSGGMNAAIEAHDFPLAGTWLGRVTADTEKDPQILREKERYLSFVNKFQESADAGRLAIKVLPHDRDVMVYLGYDLLRLNQDDELLQLTSQYMDTFPKEPDIALLQGYVHKSRGQDDLAVQDFTLALQRDPNVVTAYVNRAYTLNDLHRPKDAASDFEAAIKREPGNGEAHLGLAYADLEMGRSQASLHEVDLAEKVLGDSKDLHLIRATAYGRQEMLTKAANEYRAALKFAPDDGVIHLGLANVIFAQRRYHDAIAELEIALKDSPDNGEVYALLARSYAALDDRNQALKYVDLAEQQIGKPVAPPPDQHTGKSLPQESPASTIYVSTGEALSMLGEHAAAMVRFTKALASPRADRVGVRLSIAGLMAQQGHADDAERQVALAQMEGEAGEAELPTGRQYIAAADVLRSLHDYQLSEAYLGRAKEAGAPDAAVRIGLANSYLAMGDTARARGELAAVNATADSTPEYQYLLTKANIYRQEHHDAQALTSFAQASNAEGEDQSAEQSLLQAGANEGLRLTPVLSTLSYFSVDPIFEDSTVYVLDAKLDASVAVPPTDTSKLPPPRSSVQTQWTDAYHVHLAHLPTIGGFFQIRNARGQISVPALNSVVNRDTTDYTFNVGLSPTVNLGRNTITLNGGVQEIIRRDADSPVALNQNLFRLFGYVSTSSFFNAISVSGFVIRETGPFTDSNLHSTAVSSGVDFRVGAPWGRTAFVTGWGASDQQFLPSAYENYFTSMYAGLERRFGERLDIRAVAEDLRAWRIVGPNSGIAQNLRPAGTVDFKVTRNWAVQGSTSYSSTRSFHVYDATQNGLSVSYARPFGRKYNDDSGELELKYPIRFSGGIQEQTFINFTGGKTTQFRPYIGISLF